MAVHDQRQDARYEEPAAAQLGVEPHPHPRVERYRPHRSPGPHHPLDDNARRVLAHDHARVVHASGGEGGVRAVGDGLEGGWTATGEVRRKSLRDHERQGGLARLQGVVHLLRPVDPAFEGEVARADEVVDQRTARRGVVEVVDDHRDPVDVQVGGVPKEDELQHRRQEHHAEPDGVPPELEHLFDDDVA